MTKAKQTRQEKAQALYDAGVHPVQIASHAWEVEGSNGKQYQVEKLTDGTWNCTCPDWSFRMIPCKHCHLVMLTLQPTHETCETCERSSNHAAVYLWCGYDRAFKKHEQHACTHYIAHTLVEADADLVVC